MPPSELGQSRRHSWSAFQSLEKRKERQEQSLRSDRQAGITPTPPQTPRAAVSQAPLSHQPAVNFENRAQAQARGPPSSDFGPYENANINDYRQLPFDIQHSIGFQMCITLEGAIFDFTKEWAPHSLAASNLTSAKKVELNFWERFLAAPIIDPRAFENRNDIPRYHQLLERVKEIRHTFVHRKEPPVLYVEQMLADSIEMTRMIRDERRAQKLEQIYQVVHYMGSLLRDQITNESKTILEDRLQAGRRAQDMPIHWLEANRLQKQAIEIKRDLAHDTAGFELLYANTLQALDEMMKSVSDCLTG